jgi:hypothetical protein
MAMLPPNRENAMKHLTLSACLLVLAACASVEAASTPQTGSPPICGLATRLGAVAVVPLTHWRPDQKEPPVREAIAQRALENAFRSTPCAASTKVLALSPDTARDARLAEAKASGANTAILVTVQELGPIFIISAPVLFSGWSDVKFTVEEVDLSTGATKLKFDHHRKVGGAFNLRGLGPLQGEMEIALHDVIIGPAPAK